MINKPTALITGANKGIGFEIARQLGQKGFHIFLGARNKSKGQAAHQQLSSEGIACSFVLMDVEQESSIQETFEHVRTKISQLDVLINNAAVLLDGNQSLMDIPCGEIEQTFRINIIGPILTTRIFQPLLQKGSRVVNISSGAGAITEGVSGFAPVYSISKTALNAVTLHFSHILSAKGIPVNALCPGWVRTDMGGSNASRSVEKGAETPVWLATEAPIDSTGKFFRDKKEIPW
ncbi:MAG: SDR family oxidoreductase [Bacteroidota bacterium]